jgi:hypothetical protein
MSRSNPTRTDEDKPKKKYWIGYDYEPPVLQSEEPVHWYTAYQLGYRATAWPKRDIEIDDDRYNLVEKE